MRRSFFALLLALVATAAGPMVVGVPAAEATVMVPLTIEDLAVRSRIVVRATVRQRQGVWDAEHKRIYTLTELAVSETIAGDAPTTIVIRTLGGQVDDIGMKVSGAPRLSETQDVVLFLRDDPTAKGGYLVVGMSQGLYRIERDAKGRAVAVPGVEGIAFVRNKNGARVIQEKSDAVRLSYDDFKQRVAQAANSAPTAPAVP